VIRFYGVSKHYGGQSALDDVSFEVPGGEFVFLSGSSGAGKSTLLRLIYREELPSSGQILVAGRNVATMPEKKIPFLRRSIGIVFQDFRLIARKTVFENVAYLPRILGETPARQQELALEALNRVGLGHRMRAFPRELSGGEQQRVAVARAVIRGPKLLLADEPTGNLDPDLSIEILRMFLEIQSRGTTVFMATHDRSLIERIGGRILTLHKGRLAGDDAVRGTEERRTLAPLAHGSEAEYASEEAEAGFEAESCESPRGGAAPVADDVPADQEATVGIGVGPAGVEQPAPPDEEHE
jgi:cell division transport system ATP-binding protein